VNNHALLRRAVRSAIYANAAVVSVGLPTLATAQTAPAAEQPEAAAPVAEVVVTGSRIVNPALQAISPVTTVSADVIKSQGTTRIEDMLNNLPQVVANQGSMSSNGASGTATVDLRGLGPQRTLVLINGRRLMPGTPSNTPSFAAPDLNNIPAALVERVDVLTGGASAVYGADATAGVVNFIMNDHFQGFRIDGNAAMYNHSQHNYYGQFSPAAGFGEAPSSVNDGKTKDITFILGGNFADDKGNAVAYLGYRRIDSLLQSQRDFSRCTLATIGGEPKCSGSSTSATGRFFSANFLPPPSESVPNFLSPTLTVNTTNGTFRPYTSSDAFNFGALNFYQRPDERWTGGAFAHYNWDEKHSMYTEFMFMNDHTLAQIAPSGAFIGSGNGVNPVTGNPDGQWGVNCNNPLLSAQQQGVLCAGLPSTAIAQVLFGRRNVEGGNRVDDLTHTSFRLVLGTKGEINDFMNYDVYAQEGITLLQENYLNDVSINKLSASLLVVKDPLTGKNVCMANANGANGAPGCAPYNIWGTGPVDPAAVNYFTTPGFIEGKNEERVVSGNITADFTTRGIKLPTATNGLVWNIGAEYRQEFTNLRPDTEFQGNGSKSDLAGQGSATLPLNAGFHVWEGFTELRLPLVQDQPLFKELSLEGGYRYSSYTLGFNTNTYKFGIDWAPTSDVRLRGSYNRAVRVPNLQELFSEKFVALDGSADPCASSSGSPAVASFAQCSRRAPPVGLTAGQYGKLGTPGNPAGQYNGQIGGNPQLQPEIADTYTAGLVITPSILPTFNMTLDYFDIKIRDAITSYGANFIVNQCTLAAVDQLCSSTQQGQFVGVHRDDAGSIWFSPQGYVGDPLLNLGYQRTKGLDVGANYRLEMGTFGHMDFNLIGTYTFDFTTEPYPGSGTYNCAGYYGATCNSSINPVPKWKHIFTDTWATPWAGIDLMARWRHISSLKSDLANPSPLLYNPGAVAASYWSALETIGSRDYLDLMLMYRYKGLTMRLGVNNVADKDPPIIAAPLSVALPPPFFNGNTYPQVYDTLGRYLYVNLTFDF
jgi:outer membrane receptor protein involved in Fe transport